MIMTQITILRNKQIKKQECNKRKVKNKLT